MSRVFLLEATGTRTSGDFNLKDLPSSSGRLDVVCRCAIASLLDKERIREDTVFLAVLEGDPNPPLCLRFDGKKLMDLPFSEVGVAALLMRVLADVHHGEIEHMVAYWQGVSVSNKSFRALISGEYASNRIYYLHEKGKDIRVTDISADCGAVFALGSYKGLDPANERLLDELGAERLSVGPISYLSSQVITLVHDELDRRRR